jgi:predicted dehydrogenase
MTDLRFGVFGAGFWAPYQIGGWQEVEGAECVAIYNRTVSKAEKVAKAFGIPRCTETRRNYSTGRNSIFSM